MNNNLIEARKIVKYFGDLKVLAGVSLDAVAGEVVSILGPSGSGKSTLLRCINLLDKPDGGTLRVDGESIALDGTDAQQLCRLRSRVPMVFQHFNLWSHLTALDNVMEAPRAVLGLSKREARQRALYMLDKVGVAERASYYPAQLSGGQQQRVGIARALAMEPQAILFDEPTSALDPELIGEVLRVLRVLATEKVTMIIVTHEIAFARELSDKVVFLEEGKIAAEGAASMLDNPDSERFQRFLVSGRQ